MSYYFCIVGTRDNLLYEADLSSLPSSSSAPLPSGDAFTSSGGSHPIAQGDRSSRTSSRFGFSSALGQWTQAFPLRSNASNTSSSNMEANREDSRMTASAFQANERHLLQMIAHGSLDMLEDRQYIDNAMYVYTPTNYKVF